ncbi:BRO family protein [Serratia ureilytica]|uniref:BRO family protein n=1 Tax=Serratia ureilytica TaxID=300181 RepID=UPI002362DED2|nr:BRO family protein [Serratia ureilytica]
MKAENMVISPGQSVVKIQESNISSFEFKSVDGALLARVGVATIDGQPWFIASDVAAALEYSQTQGLTRLVDGEDKNSAIIQNGCNYKNQSLINESGLYTAVIGSNKPEAKRFKRWITAEVLPEIRKTGSYLLPAIKAELPDFSDEVAAARAWADAREEGRRALALTYQQAEYIHHLENLFAEGLTPVQFCKRLNGVNTSRINTWLSGKSWLFDENPNGRNARWRVYAYARDRYLTEKNTRVEHGDGFTAFTPVLLHKGAVWIYRHYLKGELPMKANWNGEYTHDKELAGGGNAAGTE